MYCTAFFWVKVLLVLWYSTRRGSFVESNVQQFINGSRAMWIVISFGRWARGTNDIIVTLTSIIYVYSIYSWYKMGKKQTESWNTFHQFMRKPGAAGWSRHAFFQSRYSHSRRCHLRDPVIHVILRHASKKSIVQDTHVDLTTGLRKYKKKI